MVQSTLLPAEYRYLCSTLHCVVLFCVIALFPLSFKVRLASLEVLCEMAHKLGEDFLPLLPETVPFLAELLEDEEEAVELACQKAVQDLEEVLGEPLKKYF